MPPPSTLGAATWRVGLAAMLVSRPVSAHAGPVVEAGGYWSGLDSGSVLGVTVRAGYRLAIDRYAVSLLASGSAGRRVFSHKAYIDPHDAWFEYENERCLGGRLEGVAATDARDRIWLGAALEGGVAKMNISCRGDFCWWVQEDPPVHAMWAGASALTAIDLGAGFMAGAGVGIRYQRLREPNVLYWTLNEGPFWRPRMELRVGWTL